MKTSSFQYHFKLYVTGATARSTRAISMLRAICEQHFPGKYRLQVIDIYQQPDQARKERILVAPTVIRLSPAPVRRMAGDISDPSQLLRRLGLPNGSRTLLSDGHTNPKSKKHSKFSR